MPPLKKHQISKEGVPIIAMKEVPAKICTICGEYYLSTEISTKVLQKAEEAFNKGVEIEVIKLNSVA